MMKAMTTIFKICLWIFYLGQGGLWLGSIATELVIEDESHELHDSVSEDNEDHRDSSKKKQRRRKSTEQENHTQDIGNMVSAGMGLVAGYMLSSLKKEQEEADEDDLAQSDDFSLASSDDMVDIETGVKDRFIVSSKGHPLSHTKNFRSNNKASEDKIVALSSPKKPLTFVMGGTPKGSPPEVIRSCGGRYCLYGHCLHDLS